MKGLNRSAGGRNRCYACISEYHYTPQRPRRGRRSSSLSPYQHPVKTPPSPPYPSIVLGSPLREQPPAWEGQMGSGREYEHPSSTNMEIGGQFVCVPGDSVVVLDRGAAANLACFKWPGNRNSLLQKRVSRSWTHIPRWLVLSFGMDELAG